MPTYSFTERGPLEQGFEKVFHERIVPILEQKEIERVAAYTQLKLGLAACGAVGVGAALVAVLSGAFSLIPFVVLALIAAIGWWNWRTNKWNGTVGSDLLPVLCDFLGNMNYNRTDISLEDFERLGLTPSRSSFNLGGGVNISLEDGVVGTHDGLNWALAEAVITRKGSDNSSESRSLLFQIEIFGEAPPIFFLLNMGKKLNALAEQFSSQRKGMDKIETGNPEFDEIYATYTTDRAAALSYIDDNLTDGLLYVAKAETGSDAVACAMEGTTLYLVLYRDSDFLGIGSIKTSLTMVEKDLHEALIDLDLPRRVLDQLRGK